MSALTLRDYVEMVLEGYTLHPGARKILEQAIAQEQKPLFKELIDKHPGLAQELVSQAASANPVVPKKTAETVDKDCDTCNNRHKRMHQEPCSSCHGYTNWEPKP